MLYSNSKAERDEKYNTHTYEVKESIKVKSTNNERRDVSWTYHILSRPCKTREKRICLDRNQTTTAYWGIQR